MGCLKLATRWQVRGLLLCLQGDAALATYGMTVRQVGWCAHVGVGYSMTPSMPNPRRTAVEAGV
jgi:hypothetical protein